MELPIQTRFREVRMRLQEHPIYQAIHSRQRVARFMEVHVFAVWDFMSLLKRLQREVTCVTIPWMPPNNSELARLLNEITLGEETDEDGRGGYASHFELYLAAMAEVGSDTTPIGRLIERLQSGMPYHLALRSDDLSSAVRKFVRFNLELATDGEPHRVAAAFFHGREDLIPEMFARLLPGITAQSGSVPAFEYYVRRHIELDGDCHGRLAQRLLESLTHGDPRKEQEALETACMSLELRSELWDAALDHIAGRG